MIICLKFYNEKFVKITMKKHIYIYVYNSFCKLCQFPQIHVIDDNIIVEKLPRLVSLTLQHG